MTRHFTPRVLAAVAAARPALPPDEVMMYVFGPCCSYACWQTAPIPWNRQAKVRLDPNSNKGIGETHADFETRARLQTIHLQIHIMLSRQHLRVHQRRHNMQRGRQCFPLYRLSGIRIRFHEVNGRVDHRLDVRGGVLADD